MREFKLFLPSGHVNKIYRSQACKTIPNGVQVGVT